MHLKLLCTEHRAHYYEYIAPRQKSALACRSTGTQAVFDGHGLDTIVLVGRRRLSVGRRLTIYRDLQQPAFIASVHRQQYSIQWEEPWHFHMYIQESELESSLLVLTLRRRLYLWKSYSVLYVLLQLRWVKQAMEINVDRTTLCILISTVSGSEVFIARQK